MTTPRFERDEEGRPALIMPSRITIMTEETALRLLRELQHIVGQRVSEMVYADLGGEELAFRNEAALKSYQEREHDAQCSPDASKPALRMRRMRKRQSNAAKFWEWRIRTGGILGGLIKDVSPRILENERLAAIDRLGEYARVYPERLDIK